MSNDAKVDLVYAILTLDSYNRGYGSGISGLPSSGMIGNYSIRAPNPQEQFDWFDAGFYAIAYKKGDNTVIAYRGTDNKGVLDSETLGGSDPLNGYGIALGWTGYVKYNPSGPSETAITTQSRLAAQFYTAVTGKAEGQSAGNVTLTGHSLGGGLAGYVGDVSGTNSVLFDNMPYGVAADRRWVELGKPLQANSDVQTNAHTYYTENEFLIQVRAGNTQNILAAIASVFGADALSGFGNTISKSTANYEGNIQKTELVSYAANDSLAAPFGFYHSMALLTSLIWAKAENKTEWIPAAPLLWQSYFDEDVASTVAGIDKRTVTANSGTNSGTLRAVIAYSALGDADPGGTLVFGDTAIKAMFADAGDLGNALKSSEADGFLNLRLIPSETTILGVTISTTKTVSQAIADMLVQFAGALALGKVADKDLKANNLTSLETGPLGWGGDGNGGVLTLDLSKALWTTELSNAGAQPMTPYEGDAFRTALLTYEGDGLAAALRATGFSSLDDLAQQVWKASNAQIIDRFDIATGSDGQIAHVADRNYGSPIPATGDNTHVDLFLGTTKDDNVIGSSGNDILVGNGGIDYLDGGAGNDLLVAIDRPGAIYTGGVGSITVGGLGRDIIVNESLGGVIWGDC